MTIILGGFSLAAFTLFGITMRYYIYSDIQLGVAMTLLCITFVCGVGGHLSSKLDEIKRQLERQKLDE